MEMREHAVTLVSGGYRVLPLHWPLLDRGTCSCSATDCKSVGKHPLNHDGSTGASDDKRVIEAWWDRWPNANIGIATGGLVDVIDIDGPQGQAVFDDYVLRFGVPLHVAKVQTGRIGGHHYYVTPGGLQNWTGGFGGHPKGLDVKGVGGYVVAPPSLHETGNRYQWTLEPSAEPPRGHVDWSQWHADVKALVSAPVPVDVAKADTLTIRQPKSSNTRGLGFAEVVKQRVITEVSSAGEGARWQTLAMVGVWGMAGLVLGKEISESEALDLCEDLAREIGLGGAEIRRLPGELQRALSKRREPIQSRGASVPTPDAGSALTVDPGGLADGGSEALQVETQTAYYRVQMLARERAKNELRKEALGNQRYASKVSLDALLARPIEPTQYRIDGLWPIGGRAMLAAQFKAGKTTLVGNVLRSLADAARFLNRYQANTPIGSIALFDTEMSEAMLQGWLRDQAIANTGKVWLAPMRGLCGGFDITDDLVRARWAQELKDENTEIMILDCLGPVLAALGLDENNNQEVGTFIGAFEALLSEADIREALIVHHMGHAGERSRGASRLRDWPDVEWQLIREGQEDEGTPSADVPRYFRAYGRDVQTPEMLLSYEPQFRWLTVNGSGNRAEVKASRKADEVIAVVIQSPGINQSALERAVKGKAEIIRAAIKPLVDAGTLRVVEGPRNALLYFHKDYRST